MHRRKNLIRQFILPSSGQQAVKGALYLTQGEPICVRQPSVHLTASAARPPAHQSSSRPTSLNVSSSRLSISLSSSIGIPSAGSIRMTWALE